jgi:hypothetical protein
MSHTPGPWTYANVAGKDGQRPKITTVAYCGDFVIGLASEYPGGYYRDGDPSGDEESDARLIAAAPDLLEALDEAQYWVNQYMDQNDCDIDDEDLDVSRCMRKIRAAIAKATDARKGERWE